MDEVQRYHKQFQALLPFTQDVDLFLVKIQSQKKQMYAYVCTAGCLNKWHRLEYGNLSTGFQ